MWAVPNKSRVWLSVNKKGENAFSDKIIDFKEQGIFSGYIWENISYL